MFKKYIRETVKGDLYALLDEIDNLRVDVNTLGKNMYDATFALAIATNVTPKKLATQFEDKKLHDYVVKFQKDLDTFEAQLKQKRAKELAKQVAKKAQKSLGKKA